ncbi:MOSC domain-containing protein [Phaeovulum vinaykumarii]|uniref:MOSC domain-containing protein n=1 Tax=Phaeovulum vinaykumarii TaxID=407234 RepID=A0A1N7LAL7_9RHOB|nr:MOSC N-terminal beta barrel domain-containing protein [Phaeovulum vinaykumarii]SIS70847.1 hypothetical protein SAMN05421795_102759 [Phaeovulum vinaykumarii]SOB98688.1 hypothetical protein SAMN05878426_10213 [Phaeovulum vinaykumarii]
MAATLARILRHPIKSIGVEEIADASLAEGGVLPFDRAWAVAHAAATFDGDPRGWAPKSNFLRGAAAPALMAVRARMEGGRIALSHPRRPAITIAPAQAADRARLLDWLAPLWPEGRPAPRDLVPAPAGQALSDARAPWLSILSLSSNAALGRAMGRDLSIHRWRGNLWIEGWPEDAERALGAGTRLRVGGAILEVARPITRCRATCADPETGAEAGDTLAALQARFGDRDFGLYAAVLKGGPIRRGDPIEVLA